MPRLLNYNTKTNTLTYGSENIPNYILIGDLELTQLKPRYIYDESTQFRNHVIPTGLKDYFFECYAARVIKRYQIIRETMKCIQNSTIPVIFLGDIINDPYDTEDNRLCGIFLETLYEIRDRITFVVGNSELELIRDGILETEPINGVYKFGTGFYRHQIITNETVWKYFTEVILKSPSTHLIQGTKLLCTHAPVLNVIDERIPRFEYSLRHIIKRFNDCLEIGYSDYEKMFTIIDRMKHDLHNKCKYVNIEHVDLRNTGLRKFDGIYYQDNEYIKELQHRNSTSEHIYNLCSHVHTYDSVYSIHDADYNITSVVCNNEKPFCNVYPRYEEGLIRLTTNNHCKNKSKINSWLFEYPLIETSFEHITFLTIDGNEGDSLKTTEGNLRINDENNSYYSPH